MSKNVDLDEFENPIEALAHDTGFELGTMTRVLNSRSKVHTPIEALNCLLGGGIPFGTVAQSFGEPKVGKSTWMYQMMGEFQHQYPNGISAIIDSESSADNDRLEYLGVDISKVLRLPATSIESGFLSLLKMLENKSNTKALKDVPVFVIWDTISKGLAQDGSTQSRMNAQDRARIIKNYMSPVMAEIEKHDFILCLLNQVIYKTDMYGHTRIDAGGGVGLKHDVHFSTKITKGNDIWEGNFLVKRVSNIEINKSKISPEVAGIQMVMDISNGGRIDEVESFCEYILSTGLIQSTKGWYTLSEIIERVESNPEVYSSKYSDILKDYDKKFRWKDLVQMFKDTKIIYDIFRLYLMEYISSIYKLQSKVIKDYKENCIKEIDSIIESSDN